MWIPQNYPKEETLPTITELEENLSMEISSMMRTSKNTMIKLDFFLWPMLEKTQMEVNFSLPLFSSPWLDGKHVVFGEVINGYDIVKKIEALGTQSGKPKKKVIIAECGQL